MSGGHDAHAGHDDHHAAPSGGGGGGGESFGVVGPAKGFAGAAAACTITGVGAVFAAILGMGR